MSLTSLKGGIPAGSVRALITHQTVTSMLRWNRDSTFFKPINGVNNVYLTVIHHLNAQPVLEHASNAGGEDTMLLCALIRNHNQILKGNTNLRGSTILLTLGKKFMTTPSDPALLLILCRPITRQMEMQHSPFLLLRPTMRQVGEEISQPMAHIQWGEWHCQLPILKS